MIPALIEAQRNKGTLLRIAVCGYAIALRLAELRASRRHIRSFDAVEEGKASRATYPLMVLVHTMVLVGTPLFGKKANRFFLAVFLLAQPVRVWVLRSLGRAWNTRGAVPSDMRPVTTGPYAHIRHPNYSIVVVELFALPAAFSLPRLAFIATVANALVLAVRIRDEEALLMKLPGYEEHFGRLPRFVPRIKSPESVPAGREA